MPKNVTMNASLRPPALLSTTSRFTEHEHGTAKCAEQLRYGTGHAQPPALVTVAMMIVAVVRVVIVEAGAKPLARCHLRCIAVSVIVIVMMVVIV
jgi:hypothetical protein